jgi:hypothetical protein
LVHHLVVHLASNGGTMRVLRRSVILVVALAFIACHAPVTIVTPQGKAAWQADQILKRVEELQNAAISANAAGAFPLPATKVINNYAMDAAYICKAAPQGWQEMLKKGWELTKADVNLKPYLNDPIIRVTVSVIDQLIRELMP